MGENGVKRHSCGILRPLERNGNDGNETRRFICGRRRRRIDPKTVDAAERPVLPGAHLAEHCAARTGCGALFCVLPGIVSGRGFGVLFFGRTGDGIRQPRRSAGFFGGQEETLVVPGAAVPVDSAGQNEVYRASGSVLAHSLETGAEEVEGARSVPGFTSITTFKGLNSMQFLARAQILRELLAGGVCVMDPNNT